MTVKGTEERVRLRLRVSGRVQGVFFRASTKEEADRLGLAGFVRNLPDGTVEIEAEGARERVDELVRWSRSGPPDAIVSGVEVTELAPRDERGRFRIAY